MFAPAGTRVRLNVRDSACSGFEVGEYTIAPDGNRPPRAGTTRLVNPDSRNPLFNCYVKDEHLSLITPTVDPLNPKAGDVFVLTDDNGSAGDSNSRVGDLVEFIKVMNSWRNDRFGPTVGVEVRRVSGGEVLHVFARALAVPADSTPVEKTYDQMTVKEFTAAVVAKARVEASRRGSLNNVGQVNTALTDWLLLDNSDLAAAKANLAAVFTAANAEYSWCPEGVNAMVAMGLGDLVNKTETVILTYSVSVVRTAGMTDTQVREFARDLMTLADRDDLVGSESSVVIQG